MAKRRSLKKKGEGRISQCALSAGMALIMLLISSNWIEAQENADPTCPVKKLNGIEAQEMMVKGVLMHTELEKQDANGHTKYTFVYTVRADWNIWICIQGVDVKGRQPGNITLSCTACDY